MTRILLVRHGHNEWVGKKRLAGWTPGVHLDEAGRAEAEALSNRLAALPLKAVYSSPLERCLQTAEAIAAPHNLDVTTSEEFGEVRYGAWEGKKIEKLSQKPSWQAVQHYPSRFRFPEGESLRSVQQRAVNAIESLTKEHAKELIAVVSHADVIKLVLAYYLGMHIDLFQRIALAPASVSVIDLSENGLVRVVRMNDDGPIKAPEKQDEAASASEDAAAESE
jgi:probable phosphomutase (TIGR03848 family)